MARGRDRFDETAWESPAAKPRTILDLCTEAFLLVTRVREGQDPGHPDDLRQRISSAFLTLERGAQKSGYAEEDVKAARYALCALIDESLLNSHWSFRDQWAERTLQLEHFDDHMVGDKFFTLLGSIRDKGRKKADLLEVFCLSLILGFEGKYKLQDRDALQQLIRTLVDEVDTYREGSPGLSPRWKVPEEPREPPPRAVPAWMLISGAVALVFVLAVFVALSFWLGSLSESARVQMRF